MIGVETTGTLKSITCGESLVHPPHGMGYGDNAKAAVITRGLAEITRLGETWADQLTQQSI